MPQSRHDTVDRAARKARFAELVADGEEPSDATRMMGLTRGQGARLWMLIKRDLGAQAV